MKRLVELRQAAGKSQQEMADFLQIARPTYTNYEKGKREPDLKTMKKLADYFQVSIEELMDFGITEKKDAPTEDSIDARIQAAVQENQKLEAIYQILLTLEDDQLEEFAKIAEILSMRNKKAEAPKSPDAPKGEP